MSASFNEITYRIFNIVRPKISDDSSIDISEIQYDVENTRAMLIKRRFSNKFRTEIPEAIVQPIKRLEIESVNASNLTSNPDIPSDKVLMRTKLEIPRLLEKSSGLPMVKRASSSTILSSNFSIVTPQQAITSGNGKFNSKNIFCFYENDRLYLITGLMISKAIKYIDLYAVFERPTKYFDFMNANYSPNPAFSHDSDYPVMLDMIDDIEQIIIKNKLKIESTQPIDDINDSSDTGNQIQAQ